MSSDRLIGTALLSPVVLAIALSFSRLITEAGDVPDDADYGAAADFLLARGLDDDDAVVLLPPWSLRPLTALGPLAARVVGGDGPWWALADRRFARVFLIEEPDGAAWRQGIALPSSSSSSKSGAVVTSELVSVPARFDFQRRLSAARVELQGSSTVACVERARGGVRCAGRPAWQRVTREWALVTENGREVIWAHPPPAGERLAIHFDDVELGSTLVIAAGHTREGAEHATSAVRLLVKVDDDVIATLVREPSFVVEPLREGLRQAFVGPVDPRGQGFRVEHIDTRRFAGTRHRVSFLTETDDDAGDAGHQHFAFDAFVPGGP